MAKLCQIQLQRLSRFYVIGFGHEGYENSRTRNIPRLAINDVRYQINIEAFGEWGSNRHTYLTCSTLKRNLGPPGDTKEVTYEFIGKWHELEEEVKKYD